MTLLATPTECQLNATVFEMFVWLQLWGVPLPNAEIEQERLQEYSC